MQTAAAQYLYEGGEGGEGRDRSVVVNIIDGRRLLSQALLRLLLLGSLTPTMEQRRRKEGEENALSNLQQQLASFGCVEEAGARKREGALGNE